MVTTAILALQVFVQAVSTPPTLLSLTYIVPLVTKLALVDRIKAQQLFAPPAIFHALLVVEGHT